MSTAPPPIHADAVHKVYDKKVHALRGASFTIQAGDHACLLGPNGAGKTTLIRMMSGALRPTGGRVTLFGEDADSPRFLEAKRRVGIVPQSAGMYRELTARQYLDLVQRTYRRGSPDRAVEAFGLGEYLDRPMAQLSGGTQRRLSLAAALLSDPELLLLDEPTAGMDPLVSREVRGYLREAMQGRTVLLCTHDLDEAELLCDSAVILRAGEVLVHDRIETLRRRWRAHVVLRAPHRESLLQALQGLGRPGSLTEAGAVQVSVDSPEREVPGLLRGLLAAGMEVYEARVVEPTLEELFVDLVQGRVSAKEESRAA